ncbi:MAG: transporter [Hyphomicrobium sp.]|nr:transporter [Hyphomicrobium sp.]
MQLAASLNYTLIPVAAAVLGAAIAAYRRPGPLVASAIQHFAAGVVFAAAAGEILPSLKHQAALWPIVIGGGAGIIVMLLIKEIEDRNEGQTGLVTLVGVDVFIDGLVLGLGFAASAKAGLLLTIALTLEVLFLGLSLAAELGDAAVSRARTVGIVTAVALLLPAGVAAASTIENLSLSVKTGFFAFGLIALLYLVTEELLVEAHETPDRPWVTALFFIGFLLLLVLEELMG